MSQNANNVNMDNQFVGTLGLINRYYQNQRNPTNIRILKPKPTTNQTVNGVVRLNSQMIRTYNPVASTSGFTTIYDPVSKKTYRIVRRLSQPQVANNIAQTNSASQLVTRGRKVSLQPIKNLSPDTKNNVQETTYMINLDSDSGDEAEITQVPTEDDDSINETDSVVESQNDDCSFKISNIVTLSNSQSPTKPKETKPKANKTHIKRPLNAFMAYSKVARRQIMNDDPMLHHAAVSKKLGSTWKALSEEQKKPYYDEAKRLAEEHSQKYPDYKYKPRPKRAKTDFKPDSPPKLLQTYPSANNQQAKDYDDDVVMNESNISNEELQETQNEKPDPERNASGFHSWSLIYDSSEDEEEGEEEEDDD